MGNEKWETRKLGNGMDAQVASQLVSRVVTLLQGYVRLRVSVKENSGVHMLCKIAKVRR